MPVLSSSHTPPSPTHPCQTWTVLPVHDEICKSHDCFLPTGGAFAVDDNEVVWFEVAFGGSMGTGFL